MHSNHYHSYLPSYYYPSPSVTKRPPFKQLLQRSCRSPHFPNDSDLLLLLIHIHRLSGAHPPKPVFFSYDGRQRQGGASVPDNICRWRWNIGCLGRSGWAQQCSRELGRWRWSSRGKDAGRTILEVGAAWAMMPEVGAERSHSTLSATMNIGIVGGASLETGDA